MSALENVVIKFEHTVKETELVLAGLSKLPFELVNELIQKLHASANQQVQDHLASEQTTSVSAPAMPTPEPEESVVKTQQSQ